MNDLESDNSSLTIRLEITKGQISNQNDKLENLKYIEAEKDAISVLIKERETKVNRLENMVKEKDENLLICEFTLKNRNSELEKLKQEFETLKNLFYCEGCDFSSATDTELKCHIGNQHEHHCPY